MAVGAFAVSVNILGSKYLPVFEVVILVMFIIGFLAVIIPLWVLAPRASTADVFGKFENWGGWSSTGGACIVGQMAASAAFIVSILVNCISMLSRKSLITQTRVSTVQPTCRKKSKTPPSPSRA